MARLACGAAVHQRARAVGQKASDGRRPARPGIAIGHVDVGTTPVNADPRYVGGPIDGDLYIVELINQALAEASLAAELKLGGGQVLLRTGKAQGLMFYVQ